MGRALAWLTGLDGSKISGPVANAVNATHAASFSGALAGDVTGAQGTTTVAALRGRPLAATAPCAGQVLQFDGTQWAPGTVAAGAAGGGGVNGFSAVSQPGTYPWTAPAGVNKVLFEFWGASGGGGGGAGVMQCCSSPGGGGGGGGGYLRGVVTVTPGVTYELVVGAPGAPGSAGTVNAVPGGNGGATLFRGQGDGTVLAAANGGSGGGAACICPPGPGSHPTAGAGGTGGDATTSSNSVRLLGTAGSDGTVANPGNGGLPGTSVNGTVLPIVGGRGGDGSRPNAGSTPGEVGRAGYALLQW